MRRLIPDSWTIADAVKHYDIDRWGDEYFSISENGDVQIVCPGKDGVLRISFMDVIEGLLARGLDMPVLLRIENILDHRIAQLNEAFAQAINDAGYQNVYRGLFPIKVNQQAGVIKEIMRAGHPHSHGLEAGSKAELMIALAEIEDNDSYVVCNGFKDSEFVELGLSALQLGIQCFFVIETLSELEIIIEQSKIYDIKPLLGVRLKLASTVDGHWKEDSGDRSIFGLTATQLIQVVDRLKQENMLDCLKMLHFHLGSQIPNIRNIRVGVEEACRYYLGLREEGAPLGFLDLGGGLGVDYEGTNSSDSHSKNYHLQEYCIDIVEKVMEVLDTEDVPHPVLMSESGRATVAYSSVLLFNILNNAHFEPLPESEIIEDRHEVYSHLLAVAEELSLKNVQESYNDALYYRDEARQLFRLGQLDLHTRSICENLFLRILQNILQLLPDIERMPVELEDLEDRLADIYYGNFSVFQSLPDHWAIDQTFPVMPLHRLNEVPTRNAVLADLTCDCDGKIDRFIGQQSTLSLHRLKEKEEYYLGVFLVGAYQETLGDLHNLFGDTNIASIRIHADNSFDFTSEAEGDSITEVLSYVEYDPLTLVKQFRNKAEKAVRDGYITLEQRQSILKLYNESMRGYTYYER